MRRLKIYPNAYYNYRKQRKSAYQNEKKIIKEKISKIYHDHNGVVGYRMVKLYLEKDGIIRSNLTIHNYMNKELRLRSITRRKRPNYRKGKPHRIFENKISQNFTAAKINQKWCTDFTYLYLKNGEKCYNCTVIDLHDRSVVASLTDRKITSDLAIRTIQKAFDAQGISHATDLILHSDQGSQYTSKEFVNYCEKQGILQSMSKAGYPYDNAPMERYFNTMKSELIYQHEYDTESALYEAIEHYAYQEYNMERPHTFNNGKTPFQARYCAW